MEPTSLAALRQYQMARQAIGSTPLQPGMPNPQTSDTQEVDASRFNATLEETREANPIVEGIQNFSNVFEQVETATEAMATGQGDAHAVVEALATAEVALETAVTIRNRVVEAYQELLRMPI